MAKNKKISNITAAGMIAAAYAVLTLVSALCGLSSGIIQVRISEALCVLPFFTSAAIPGLSIGCFISNILCGGDILDAVFGTAATLIGAVCAYYIGKAAKRSGSPLLKASVPFPNIIANTLIIPWVLRFVYGENGAIIYFTLTVFIGEAISAGVLGLFLLFALSKRKNIIK